MNVKWRMTALSESKTEIFTARTWIRGPGVGDFHTCYGFSDRLYRMAVFSYSESCNAEIPKGSLQIRSLTPAQDTGSYQFKMWAHQVSRSQGYWSLGSSQYQIRNAR
ncbi:hypothetical protein BDBG_17330 [Blastomyces gilchristii SLH14081]|uniref:Uncharacterized protein n=1 Tax=Blastomyces gilchristii (strain SLH14081) TaxID=559298 RepID=A0A179USK0_BLAGS|nr:uncharacterized protein BDBG_17330 [Blastomyces gilchristii SLH14081]OAT10219.1 hypothetical protein BDBG_17330 [Blastomyces gilchristii SLH14081]